MEVNELIQIIKKKIEKNILLENITINDKTYLHTKHKSHTMGKFHLELRVQSEELKKYSKIESNKKIFKILDNEIKKYIHSIQILID